MPVPQTITGILPLRRPHPNPEAGQGRSGACGQTSVSLPVPAVVEYWHGQRVNQNEAMAGQPGGAMEAVFVLSTVEDQVDFP